MAEKRDGAEVNMRRGELAGTGWGLGCLQGSCKQIFPVTSQSWTLCVLLYLLPGRVKVQLSGDWGECCGEIEGSRREAESEFKLLPIGKQSSRPLSLWAFYRSAKTETGTEYQSSKAVERKKKEEGGKKGQIWEESPLSVALNLQSCKPVQSQEEPSVSGNQSNR